MKDNESSLGKDPAFLFYPGDYLRDTQCLSERSQVAYDRIMCEHMRFKNSYEFISNHMNFIEVSKDRVMFFIKRLSDIEKDEILSVLTETDTGYYIDWVRSSIYKRKRYTDSRGNNRRKKSEIDMNSYENISIHTENEIENVINHIDTLLSIDIARDEKIKSLLSEIDKIKNIHSELNEKYIGELDQKEKVRLKKLIDRLSIYQRKAISHISLLKA